MPKLPAPKMLWKGKEPGLHELTNLLNLYPEAALILNWSKQSILRVNVALSKLTAYGPNELVGTPVVQLLPDLDVESLNAGMSRLVNVQRCKRSPLAVQMQVNALDAGGRWLLISLVPGHRMVQKSWQEKTFEGLARLSSISEADNPYKYLTRTVETIQGIVDAGLVSVYHNFPDLEKLAFRENPPVFPDTINANDLGRLTGFTLWNPGKRVQTEIHRAARLAELTYVATIPLGEGKSTTGLLVVADAEKDPIPNLKSLMGIFGAIISSALQHFVLVDAMCNDIHNKSEELATFQAFIDNSPEGILLLQPDLKINEINPSAEFLLGYSRNEVIGQPVEKVLIGSEQLILALQVACQGVPTHNIGVTYLNKRHGDTFATQIQIIPVRGEDTVKAILVYIADVSEHEQFRARTQQLEQRAVLGQFSSVIAHELKNPINNIGLNLQYIAKMLPEGDPIQGNINRMVKDSRRLADLIESILSYSRLETHFQPVDLLDLINYQLTLWRPRLANLNITHTVKFDGEIPKIMADSRSLEQVFTNLISNAADAMSASGGTLAINLRPDHSVEGLPQVEVTVSDSGPGIPDEIKDRIFEPFVTSNKRGGTGLGLAITRQIINAHGGFIKVDSYPGVTIFRVLLRVDHQDKK
jgi:two-component system sensor histidine kinase AtoS